MSVEKWHKGETTRRHKKPKPPTSIAGTGRNSKTEKWTQTEHEYGDGYTGANPGETQRESLEKVSRQTGTSGKRKKDLTVLGYKVCRPI